MNENCLRRYFAKSPDANGYHETVHDHLQKVAAQAAQFGKEIGQEQAAWLAGQWHDFGKYSESFQQVLSGIRHGVDHAFPGAAYLYYLAGRYPEIEIERLRSVIEAVNGHHDGLRVLDELIPDIRQAMRASRQIPCLSGKIPSLNGGREYQASYGIFQGEFSGFDLRKEVKNLPLLERVSNEGRMLHTRMLFSCLVDADYSVSAATAAGEEGKETISPEPAWDRMIQALDAHCLSLSQNSSANAELNALRGRLFACCGEMGEKGAGKGGLYTLTAPTGTGKTLALLNFALRQGKRRIIIVLPFLSLIEQTARAYSKIIPDIFEDRSQREYEGEYRELSARWDHPFILTTSVRFFETLFRWKPGDCRKLHNIAGSVIIFDEAQSLPGALATATLRAVRALCDDYGCSVVFSTATQPNYHTLIPNEWQPTEICLWHAELYKALRRTDVQWRVSKPTPLETIAGEMAQADSVCCIVNLRRHAKRLFELLEACSPKEEIFFLSTDLCPAHRSAQIDCIRERLAAGLPCRVVSTQCIEAGVDLDFARMYRALAPLEAIIQAAGRCNRNGRLDERGMVTVFIPDESGKLYPDDAYKRGAMRVLLMLTDGGIDIHNPEDIAQYYKRLFRDAGDDKKLTDAIQRCSYEDVSRHYKLIDDCSVRVIVPYRDNMVLFEEIRQMVENTKTAPLHLLRRAAPITVASYDRLRCEDFAELIFLPGKRGQPPEPSGYYLLRPQYAQCYREDMGLQWPEQAVIDPIF